MSDTPLVKDLYTYKPSNLASNSMITGRDASQLDMNDFFNLLVAQLTNQDMLNPTSDTEFVAQMAQFTSLNGIQTIQEYQLSNYAVSYVGKDVVIAQMDEQGLKLEQITGTVTNVTFYDGSPMVAVGGKAYPLYTIMEVITPGGKPVGDKDAGDGVKEEEDNKTVEPADPDGDGDGNEADTD